MNNTIPTKIIGIQFSILSPEQIRKSSVAKISTRDTYINNKPCIGGIFDPRMGNFRTRIVMSDRWIKLYGNTGIFWSYRIGSSCLLFALFKSYNKNIKMYMLKM